MSSETIKHRGRPRAPFMSRDYEPRDQAVYVRVTATERRAFEDAAERWGMSAPEWLRWHGRKAIGLPVIGGDGIEDDS